MSPRHVQRFVASCVLTFDSLNYIRLTRIIRPTQTNNATEMRLRVKRRLIDE